MDGETISRARRGARSLLIAGALTAPGLALAPAAAHAELAAGLVGRETLVLFDTARPGYVAPRAITGLLVTDTVIGIDVRPATGQLYALAVPMGSVANAEVRTYVVDPQTGAATPIGATAAIPEVGDLPSGVDFTPRADRLRVVQSSKANLRTNPNNGARADQPIGDPLLTFTPPATGPVVGLAFDRNVTSGGVLATTLYGIDAGASRLVTQGGIDGTPSANGGDVFNVGPLGVTLDPSADAGFDVSPSGAAYAGLVAGGDSGLYTIDLATGAATLIGALPIDLKSLAILPPGSATLPPEVVVQRETITVPGPERVVTPPPPPRRPQLLLVAGATARQAALLRGRVALRFSCDTACAATATLVARGRGIATGRARLAQAGVGTIRLTATRAGRRLLAPRARRGARRAARELRSVQARLTLTATAAPGLSSATSAKLVLRR